MQDGFPFTLHPVAGAAPAWHARIAATQLLDTCREVQVRGGRLVALWGTDTRHLGEGFALHVALAGQTGLLCLSVPLDAENPAYPDIADLFPAANRMQRALYDLLGIVASNAADTRPWLRHGAWPREGFPLRKEFDGWEKYPATADDYPFVPVSGDGVHEIPVGPVHAGTIEPGHFRFSIIGERVLRLEERLGYKHKGVEKRFESLSLADGARLAGRISGDSTVAYAWAYAMALEGVSATVIPPRAAHLRALLLELERIANHLGDLGYLGNDVAFAFGFAQFWRLKEDLLRVNGATFGHRYLMDRIVPGGVAEDIAPGGTENLLALARHLEKEVHALKSIYDDHAGVQDRFLTTGRVTPERAAQLGLCGLAGRASGQSWDLRAQFPIPPYDRLDVRMATHRAGDVAARVTVRFEEIFESLRLIRRLLADLPAGALKAELGKAPPGALGLGWVEGWRGEILAALHTGEHDTIERCHLHDPSWQNWPVLEHAIIGNIVPDFPLINKSFNLSYSGQDL
jgi:Ni,Fe-hydrogenase III large subunit/Ni,Fe-hydrogenase III component G